MWFVAFKIGHGTSEIYCCLGMEMTLTFCVFPHSELYDTAVFPKLFKKLHLDLLGILTLIDMGGGMMAPQNVLTTVLKRVGGGS